MKHYDVVFLHPSALSSAPRFIIMPTGMIPLVNELEEYDVKAVNVGLELSLKKEFSLRKFLTPIEFSMAAIDLHWYEHTYSALETAELCKKLNPDCSVVLGGMTASYFAEDILNFTDSVDIIVAGEAEETMLLLLEGEDFSSIPNLCYRDDGIKKTPKKPVSSLDGLDFSTIAHLDHWEEYLKCSLHTREQHRFWYDFWLCTGRGCAYDCSYCGGGKTAHEKAFGRKEPVFRSVEGLVQDLIYLQDLGVHVVHLSHDISVAGEKYWKKLFSSMKKEGIFLGLYLNAWQLPDKEFVKALAAVCDSRFTTIAVTLLSGCESVRRKNGKEISTRDYLRFVTNMETYNLNHIPSFATGLPFETEETFSQTLTLTEKLLSEVCPRSMNCMQLLLDPGSPMYEHPEEYRIVRHYKNFKDYYNRSRKRAKHFPFDFKGYHTEFLQGKKIMHQHHTWEALVKAYSLTTAGHTLHFL